MKLTFVYIVMIVAVIAVSGCCQKKLVVKNCEQAANSGFFICDKL